MALKGAMSPARLGTEIPNAGSVSSLSQAALCVNVEDQIGAKTWCARFGYDEWPRHNGGLVILSKRKWNPVPPKNSQCRREP
eukprot:3772323-Amphidinium_carterae.1